MTAEDPLGTDRPAEAAGGATMSPMAATDPRPAPTITAPTAGELVRRVREAVGIDREALARRAGVEVGLVARAEAGEEPRAGERLDTLLLVLGHARATPDDQLAAGVRPVADARVEPAQATISASTRGQLVRAVREQLGVERESLALRAGLRAEAVAALEDGGQELTDALLDTVLLVMGYQPVPGAGGEPGAAPRGVGAYDAGHLAEELAAPMGERLERAMGWNQFAAQLAGAALERSGP